MCLEIEMILKPATKEVKIDPEDFMVNVSMNWFDKYFKCFAIFPTKLSDDSVIWWENFYEFNMYAIVDETVKVKTYRVSKDKINDYKPILQMRKCI